MCSCIPGWRYLDPASPPKHAGGTKCDKTVVCVTRKGEALLRKLPSVTSALPGWCQYNSYNIYVTATLMQSNVGEDQSFPPHGLHVLCIRLLGFCSKAVTSKHYVFRPISW